MKQWYRKYHDQAAAAVSVEEIRKSLEGYYDLKVMEEADPSILIRTPNCVVWWVEKEERRK